LTKRYPIAATTNGFATLTLAERREYLERGMMGKPQSVRCGAPREQRGPTRRKLGVSAGDGVVGNTVRDRLQRREAIGNAPTPPPRASAPAEVTSSHAVNGGPQPRMYEEPIDGINRRHHYGQEHRIKPSAHWCERRDPDLLLIDIHSNGLYPCLKDFLDNMG